MVDYLTKTELFNPRILNEILRLSPDGSMLSFLSTFTDMRTMKQMLSPSEAKEILLDMTRGDQDIVRSIVQLAKRLSYDSHVTPLSQVIKSSTIQEWIDKKASCMLELAQEIREVSWGKNITERRKNTPHPCEQTKLFQSHGLTCT